MDNAIIQLKQFSIIEKWQRSGSVAKGEGVSYYTTGYATIVVHFPENKVACQWCHYCRYDEGLKRHICRFTQELLPYWNTTIGNQCPIDFKEEQQ